MKPWFKVSAKADDPKRAEIWILEEIGYDWWDGSGVTAKSFIDAVTELGDLDQIDLHINSPGGVVFDGLTIHNFLKRHPANVTVTIDGLAASIASVIAMAGDDIIMPANAMLMIHDPWSWVAGNADEMRKVAADLDKIKSGLVTAYTDKTGLTAEDVAEHMAAETWFTAEDAVGLGYADEIEEPVKVAASYDMAAVKARVAEQTAARIESQRTPPTQDPPAAPVAAAQPDPSPGAAATPPAQDLAAMVATCTEADAPWLVAVALQQGWSPEALAQHLETVAAVRDLLAAAHIADPEPIVQVAHDPVAMARHLVASRLADDGGEIHSHLDPNAKPPGKSSNVFNIYAARNRKQKR